VSFALLLVAVPVFAASSFDPWGPAASLESVPGASTELNTPFLDGCPILSHDGLKLYMASDRPGGLGGIDIWIAERGSPDGPFGAPVNMGAPINSPSNDFCPSPMRDGKGFMFVSNRPGGCGGADIYQTFNHPVKGWKKPVNLGCQVNSSADEAGPVLSFADSRMPALYFSSTRAGGLGGSDLYLSRKGSGKFNPAEPVLGVNSTYDGARPSLRYDGLELVFDSNRPGGEGGFDIWSASRDSLGDAWSDPENLGLNVNSASTVTRGSLSWDGTTLLFGSNRPGGEGGSDIFYTTRDHPDR